MERKRLVLRVVTVCVLTLSVILGTTTADPVGEIRNPAYNPSRPIYSKPSPKPKLVLKPPQQLLVKSQASPATPALPSDVERVTQTVYGFLDFVTTIGNTVMVFTPQTKKVEAVNLQVEPSSVIAEPIQVQATLTPSTTTEELTTPKPKGPRQPKLMVLEPEPVVIEASEVEPVQVQETLTREEEEGQQEEEEHHGAILATPVQQEEQIRTQVNVVASPPNLSGEFIEGSSQEERENSGGEVEEDFEEEPSSSTTSKPSNNGKGFTLKLAPKKHNAPVLVTPSVSVPVVVTAQKVDFKPTGVLSRLTETQVKDGKSTLVETKIIGTYVGGTQYAKILETSSSLLGPSSSVTATKVIEATRAKFPGLVKPTIKFGPTKATTTTTTTGKPSEEVGSESEHDFQHESESRNFAQTHPSDEAEPESEGSQDEAKPLLDPTPTASEEQTHYILPQKPEKLYVSAVPSPNLYSRQPQLYVDINPSKSVDSNVAVVTATPSRGKQFRLNNRFTGRKNQGSDSNELTNPHEVVSVPEESTRRNSPRFGRNRGRKVDETAVSTVVVSATPTRRFKSGGRTQAPAPSKTKEFSQYKSARSFGNPARAAQANISPTSSTSIYRFKLNRPTGRWRFKPSPKPKVNIIKTKEEQEAEEEELAQGQGQSFQLEQSSHGELHQGEESRAESNELGVEGEPELAQQTIRVTTITVPQTTEPYGEDKTLEIATIKSPYVFQAGNVKNTRYITVTKTFTKEAIQPTLASSQAEATLENILATKPPYEKILEGSSDVATLPVIVLGGDMATPPLETITQSFSTTQLMLKTSILPVLYEGVTTLYTLTQSYFVTRLVTAHKTVPPLELFQFVPTKSLTEFNTQLQEAGSEHREHLLGSEDDDQEANYEHIIAPPDELTSVGSEFDPSSMDEKLPKAAKTSHKAKELAVQTGKNQALVQQSQQGANPFAQLTPSLNAIPDPLAAIPGITAEQLAFIRYFTAQNQQAQAQQQQQQHPQLPSLPQAQIAPQFPLAPLPAPAVTSSPVVLDTIATVTETKTLRLLFGSKPTHTVLYSTRVVPTRMTTYITASLPFKATQAAPAINPFLNGLPFPLAYVG